MILNRRMKAQLGLLAAVALTSAQALGNTCSVIQAGATDQSVEVIFLDETTGIPTAGLAFNSSGIDLEYRRTGAAATDITEATQTAAGAHSDGGFVSVGHGRYRLDLPDAAVAAGAREVTVLGTITGYIMAPCTVALSPAVNVVAFNGTAATASGGRPEVNATHLAGTSQTGRDIGASVLLSSGTGSGQISLSSGAVLLQPTQTGVTIPTVTTLTNAPSDSSGVVTLLSRVGTPSNLGGGASLAQNLADIEAQTDDIGAAGAGLTEAGGTGDQLTALPWNAAWDTEVQSEAADALNAYDPPTNSEMEARTLAAASYATASALATVDTVADGIKAVTDALPDAGALTSLATASALATLDGVADAIKVTTDKLDDTLEDDGGTYRFTINALEQAPAGGGGGDTDWTADERTAMRAILGIPGSGTTPADPTTGILDTIRDSVATRASQASVDDVPTAAENATANWSTANRRLTDGTNIVLAKGTGVTGFNDLSAAQVNAEVDTALGDYDGPTRAEATSDANSILSAISALNDLSVAEIRAMVVEDQGNITLGCALATILAYTGGDITTTGANSTYEDHTGAETRMTITVTSPGNRVSTLTCPSY